MRDRGCGGGSARIVCARLRTLGEGEGVSGAF